MQTSATVQNEDALWAAYFKNPSVESRNDLVLHYLHLVRRIVLRMMPKYRSFNDYDDLVSSGVQGLMDAVGRFDAVHNVKFETYAIKRIRGEILDYMRKQDWISSSMRSRIKMVQSVFDRLSVQLGREATEQDVADHLGIGVDQVREIRDNEYTHNIIYFESVISGVPNEDGVRLIDTVRDTGEDASPELQIEKKEISRVLAGVLELLPGSERTVIELYYSEELLLREIAEVLGVTESRVSQIHSKALKRIRELMERQLR